MGKSPEKTFRLGNIWHPCSLTRAMRRGVSFTPLRSKDRTVMVTKRSTTRPSLPETYRQQSVAWNWPKRTLKGKMWWADSRKERDRTTASQRSRRLPS